MNEMDTRITEENKNNSPVVSGDEEGHTDNSGVSGKAKPLLPTEIVTAPTNHQDIKDTESPGNQSEQAEGEHVVEKSIISVYVLAAAAAAALLAIGMASIYMYHAYSSLQGELTLIKRDFSSTVTGSPEFQEALNGAMQAQFKQETETLQQAQSSLSSQINKRMDTVTLDVSKLQDEAKQLRKIHPSDGLLSEIKAELNTATIRLVKLEEKNTDLERHVTSLQGKVVGIESDVAELKRARENLEREVDILKGDAAFMKRQTESLESETIAVKGHADSLHENLNTLKDTVDRVDKTCSSVKDKLQNVTHDLGSAFQLIDYLYVWAAPAVTILALLVSSVAIVCVALRRQKLKNENRGFAPQGPAGPLVPAGGQRQRAHGMNYPEPPRNHRLQRQLCLVCFSTPAMETFPRLVQERLLSQLADLPNLPVTQVRLSSNADIGNIPPSALTIVARNSETRNTILEKEGAVRGDFHLSIVNYLQRIGSHTFLLVHEDHESRRMARDRLYDPKFDMVRRDNPPLEQFIGSNRLISMGADFNEVQVNRLVEWLGEHWP